MNEMSTEDEWMTLNGYQYLESGDTLLELEIEYEEEDFKSLDFMFRDAYFPSVEDWSYYNNEQWD